MKLLTIPVVATLALLSTACGEGKVGSNPIIERDQARIEQSLATPNEYLNTPQNGGETTLKQKCEALQYFQNKMDFGGVARMSFQIGFEHPLGNMDVDQACAKMGVDTYL